MIHKDRTNHNSPVALVTGASSGFGQCIASELSSWGFRVFGTSRSGQLPNASIESVRLDITNQQSVADCVATVIERAGRVDLLVNNAGQFLVAFVEETTVESARDLMDVNVLGVLRMIQAVVPVMRGRTDGGGAGKIITIGSLGGLISVPGHGVCCASKFALEGLSKSLRMELSQFGISVSLVEPGRYHTNLMAAAKTDERVLPEYDRVRERNAQIIRREIEEAPGPQAVARLVGRVARTRHPKHRYRIGPQSFLSPILKSLFPSWFFEFHVRKTFGLK